MNMNKRLFLTIILMGLLSAFVFAQSGPYTMSIGAGAGSLTITASGASGIYSFGNARGDTADFYADVSTHETTIWNLCFFIYDKTNAKYYYMDYGFTGTDHTSNRPVDGTINIATLPTSFTNTGMTFPNSSGLTANLTVTISQPTPGNTARLTHTYAFNNTNASPIDLKMLYFADVDSYIDNASTGYATDLSSACDSDFIPHTNNYVTLAQGENDGTGKVDLNKGVKFDCDTDITDFAGFNNNTGPSYWWSNSSPYNPNGIDAVHGIYSGYSRKLELDANSDLLSDSGLDSAIVIQTDFTVPASGTKTINFYATWGLDQILSGWTPPTSVENWVVF